MGAQERPGGRSAILARFRTVLSRLLLDLLPLAAANADHLGTYALMDISLDQNELPKR